MKPLFLKYDSYIECRLCPHFCKLAPGNYGICGARKNTGEKIELITYGIISGHSLDPIEKKPLYHFFPGHNILSVGSYGCNMKCDFCQNWQISQKQPERHDRIINIDKLINEAQTATGNTGIAFTYNEPAISFEFVRDVAIRVKENGFYTVMVSNGYVNPDPLNEMLSFIDAFNIDLKAFTGSFYKKMTGAELQPVKESLIKISSSGKHLEITTLIIPGKNDSEEEMDDECRWIADKVGNLTPLHLSRYFPMYRRNDPVTSDDSLLKLFDIASKHLKYVYLGNFRENYGQDTHCSMCGTRVTTRSGYVTRLMNLKSDGTCAKCANLIYRYFTFPSRAKH